VPALYQQCWSVVQLLVSGYLQQAGCRWAEYRYSAGQRNSCHCGKSGGSVSCLGKAPVTSGNKGCTKNLNLAHALSTLPHCTVCGGEKWRWDRFWFDHLRFILLFVISAMCMFINLWQTRTVGPLIGAVVEKHSNAPHENKQDGIYMHYLTVR